MLPQYFLTTAGRWFESENQRLVDENDIPLADDCQVTILSIDGEDVEYRIGHKSGRPWMALDELAYQHDGIAHPMGEHD